jgi:hypothetical protein
MEQPKNIKLADTNMANYGGEAHEDAKERKARAELEFKGAGSKTGILVWRVENFGVKLQNPPHGEFFEGDSYIVLSTTEEQEGGKKSYALHFWLGNSTSIDERGTAAYKTVELDDLLGGAPIQYRHVQGKEAPAFLDLFGGSIRTLAGGIASAFNHVEPDNYKPRLMHIKGKKKVRVTEVPMDSKSLNNGDAFVMDNGLELIQWHGKDAGIFEKRKASEIVSNIKGERGKATSRVLDDLEEDDTFWGPLGGLPEALSDATPDEEAKKRVFQLYKVSDADGSLDCSHVASGSDISKDQLDSDDVFLFDVSDVIYCWIGKGANENEKSFAVIAAARYATAQDLGDIPVIKIPEGSESAAFNKAFA